MNLLVLVLSSQLLYYLLIAQTGIVGAWESHIHDLYPLPIGGIVGSLLSAYLSHRYVRGELYVLFIGQMILSLFYPEFSLGMMFLLGFLVGYTTPLLLFVFRFQSTLHLAFGLAIAYTVGTSLYTYPFDERDVIAAILPAVSAVALYFSYLHHEVPLQKGKFHWPVIAVMMLWIFADSALFETLSRSGNMDIWSQYTFLIITSHLLGVYGAYRYGGRFLNHTPIIWGLFVLSYGLYWIREPILLAIVYPITISYYNVLLFKTLIALANIRLIGVSMVGIGWIASSAANGVALEHQLWIAILIVGVFPLIYLFYKRSFQ